MRAGQDIAVQFPGLFIIHHNKPGQKAAAHAHDDHHLIIPLRGEFRLKAEGRESVLGPGRMIYVPAGLNHEFLATSSKEGERLICMIAPTLWKKGGTGSYPVSELPVSQVCKELLFHLLLNPKTISAQALVQTFVILFSEALEANQTLSRAGTITHILGKARDPRVQKAVSFLNENFARSDLKVAHVAKTAGLIPRNLNRLFIEELSIGPKEILIRLRLEEARRILSGKEISVTEASLRVGYQSLSRFIQAFRGLFGHLPSETR